MTTFLIAAIAFAAAFILSVLIAALSPAKPKAAERKPEITEYTGPRFTAHGREVQKTGRRVI